MPRTPSLQTRRSGRTPLSSGRFANPAKSTRSLRILVTAGPTREYIDPVRYISNDSSGAMGIAIAEHAAQRGHRITLVHGPVTAALPRAARPGSKRAGRANARAIRLVPVVSAADMLNACRRAWPRHDVLVMAAAVADYTPRAPARLKRKKSTAPLTLELAPTVDILATLARGRRSNQRVIGFALEDRAMRKNAASKLERKAIDAIVLNRPAAIGATTSTIEILVAGRGWEAPRRAEKRRHAQRIVALAETLAERT